MSELINTHDDRTTIRWKLLTGASALVLIAASPAMAGQDADHPLIWIELGANADAVSGFGDRFSAPFLEQTPTPTPFLGESPLDIQKPPSFTFGGEAKITFQPEDSDWVFSAGIRYGRSNNKRSVHHQTGTSKKFPWFVYEFLVNHSETPANYGIPASYTKYVAKFADTKVRQSERHLVLDFEAGKDVGLGLFGTGGTSVLSGGIRVARFRSHDDVTIRANPNANFYSESLFGKYSVYYSQWNDYYLRGRADRSFRGIGPSLSWNASAPIAGNVQDGQLLFDWSVNGAVLFGRQKARVSHQTTKLKHYGRYSYSTAVPTSVFGGVHYTHYFVQYKNSPPVQ
ncbi:MAG TPA: hypothetical protein VFO86_16880, partial [Terriglobia bacterium]|nr:hypothetical protein [Terriglobia bacterium]